MPSLAKKDFLIEKDVVRDLMIYIRQLGVKPVLGEVATPAGRIDVLTPNLIIEAKYIKSWKAGIGQLVAYGTFFPGKKLVLYTFGHLGQQTKAQKRADGFHRRTIKEKTKRRTIKETCRAHGIIQYHHTGNFEDFRRYLCEQSL
jgi:hypothetical protein